MEHTIRLENGTLTYWERGGRVDLVLDAHNDGRGLYKGFLQGSGGRLELGTMMPEQRSLRLRRSIPMEQLRQSGCWPITGGGLILAHSFSAGSLPQGWRKEEEPARLFPKDLILQAAAQNLHDCLLCMSREGFSLAVPYGTTKPFGMIPVFCFAKIRLLGNRQYAVFPFDLEGRPRR